MLLGDAGRLRVGLVGLVWRGGVAAGSEGGGRGEPVAVQSFTRTRTPTIAHRDPDERVGEWDPTLA